jgi:hypothetical protein
MHRLKFSEIVIIVLALLGGVGIVFFAGTRLMVTAVNRATAETGGTGFSVTGGITIRLFTFLAVLVLALIVLTAVAVWRR